MSLRSIAVDFTINRRFDQSPFDGDYDQSPLHLQLPGYTYNCRPLTTAGVLSLPCLMCKNCYMITRLFFFKRPGCKAAT